MRLIDGDELNKTLAIVAKKFARSDAQKTLMGRVMYFVEHSHEGIVRCHDCKHLTPVEGGMPLCTLHNISRVHSDFCSDGDCERECICALD